MPKKGLPEGLRMRHDWHYVEELAKTPRLIGRMIALDKIDPNPEQPRTEIGDLADLSASIKDKGVLEPLLVKPLTSNQNGQRWLIIAGERRWRAARLAGLSEVPCIEMDVDAAEIAEIALVENLQRKDLNVWEEADGLAALCQRFGYTHEDVARRIGKSRSTVTESLTIASLPVGIREKCRAAKINAKSVVLQIARQFDEAAMLTAIEAIENSQNLLPAPVLNYQSVIKADDSENSVGINVAKITSDQTTVVSSSRQSATGHVTDLSAPVRAYTYQPPEGAYKLALKFKKPVNKQDIIYALKQIIGELEEN